MNNRTKWRDLRACVALTLVLMLMTGLLPDSVLRVIGSDLAMRTRAEMYRSEVILLSDKTL